MSSTVNRSQAAHVSGSATISPFLPPVLSDRWYPLFPNGHKVLHKSGELIQRALASGTRLKTAPGYSGIGGTFKINGETYKIYGGPMTAHAIDHRTGAGVFYWLMTRGESSTRTLAREAEWFVLQQDRSTRPDTFAFGALASDPIATPAK